MDPVRNPRVDHRQNPGNEVVQRDHHKTEINGPEHFRSEQGLGETAQDREAEVSGHVNRDHRRDAAQFRRDERPDIRGARRTGGPVSLRIGDYDRHRSPLAAGDRHSSTYDFIEIPLAEEQRSQDLAQSIPPAGALSFADQRTRTLRCRASPEPCCECQYDLRLGPPGAVDSRVVAGVLIAPVGDDQPPA